MKDVVTLFTMGILSLALLFMLPNQAVVHAAPFDPAKITISPKSGPEGTEVTVKGEHFAPFSTVSITFDGDSVDTSPDQISVKNDGKFNAKFVVPDIDTDDDDDDDEEERTVRATDDSILRNSASTKFDVKGTGDSNQEEATITISPKSGPEGTEVTVKGEHFAPFSTVSITFDGDSVDTSPNDISIKDDGKFTAKFVVPDIDTDDDDEEERTVRATDDSDFDNSASESFEVTGTPVPTNEAEITLSPTSGPIGTEINVIGQFYAPSSTITITFDGDSVSTSPESISVANDGTFSAKFVVPETATEDGAQTIRAVDDSASPNSASANFGVTGNGGPPNEEEPTRESYSDAEARSQSVTVNEDNSITIMLRASNPDDSTHFSIVDNPLHGSLSGFDSDEGSILYSPNSDYFGTDRFTFRVDGNNVRGTVSITVREVNDRPTARDVQVTTLEESALEFTLAGSDVDGGDVLTFSILGVPTHGTLSGTAPNLTYLPSKDYEGYDTFRFRTSDGESNSDIATVAIRVNSVNDPPVVDAQTNVVTKENNRIRITLMATDIDSETLEFSIVSGPEHGSLSRPMTTSSHVAMSEYTPNPDYVGQDSFTFVVSDGSQDNAVSNAGIVTIMVGSPAAGSTNLEPNTPQVPAELPSEPSPSPSGNTAAEVSAPEIMSPNEVPAQESTTVIESGPDTIPPTLIVPTKTITLDAGLVMGAMVNYENSAKDNVDGVITPHCYPRSGLMFPVGESVVKCTATDKAGNISERSFAVVVKPFKFDNNSVLQLSIAIAIGAIGVAAVLMVIRKRRHNLLVKENYESTKHVLFNVYHLVKVAWFKR